ncbi:MAG: efflux RND transporter periplasmic adaptor subunit [Armatimonadia bacterium]
MSEDISAMPANGDDASPDAPAAPPSRRPTRFLGPVIFAFLLLGGAWWGHGSYVQAKTHTATDDAYLTSDMTQIAPQVTGTITQVLVHDNDMVKPGQLLVVLDESSYRAAVAQAQANLQAAIAAAQGANVSVSLTSAMGTAELQQAQGGVEQAQSGIGSAEAQVAASQATIAKSTASTREAQAGIATAQAGVEAARANLRQAQASVEAAATAVTNAKAGVRVAEASVTAASATATNAAADMKRYKVLVGQGAASRQVYDHAVSANDVAQAQVESARQQVEMAKQTVAGRVADLEAAKQRLSAVQASVSAAEAQLGATGERAHAVAEDINSARAATKVAEQGVKQARAQRVRALGQLKQAQTTPQQVALSSTNASQAQARISQAQAALNEAIIKLQRCRIYAPRAGEVSKKSATIGALVQPGTPLMSIVENEGLWVVANYKETQLAKVVPGQQAEIRVDALQGLTFAGRVDSVAAATGATFALLPPENASGNFTKIVQRVPIKIVLDPGQRDLNRLRGGMSARATINLASAGSQ